MPTIDVIIAVGNWQARAWISSARYRKNNSTYLEGRCSVTDLAFPGVLGDPIKTNIGEVIFEHIRLETGIYPIRVNPPFEGPLKEALERITS